MHTIYGRADLPGGLEALPRAPAAAAAVAVHRPLLLRGGGDHRAARPEGAAQLQRPGVWSEGARPEEGLGGVHAQQAARGGAAAAVAPGGGRPGARCPAVAGAGGEGAQPAAVALRVQRPDLGLASQGALAGGHVLLGGELTHQVFPLLLQSQQLRLQLGRPRPRLLQPPRRALLLGRPPALLRAQLPAQVPHRLLVFTLHAGHVGLPAGTLPRQRLRCSGLSF
mmetsp:Transcript_38333/g.66922  ORF Transcript_38333/g.66922 Transcript_38333/m.66922 type:complete len:224 (+) Transcript_38333:284-955(+)